jgi:mannitol/fructose-specific phosphotransferase system IIA component (Ntr-type)
MNIVIENGLEEILDILEKNGFIVEEEIDKIFIRREK